MAEPTPLPLLTAEHDVSEFVCGAEEIDDWLQRRALKGQEVGNASVFVFEHQGVVLGFYALATAGIERGQGPKPLMRNAPNPIPLLLIARLGVTTAAQGRGIAAALLRDALWRTARVSADVGFRALVIHCRDVEARGFYEHLVPGILRSPHDPLHLFLPTAVIRAFASPAAP